MATLDSFFPDAKRGDGRKFRRVTSLPDWWFEPIFIGDQQNWWGITSQGYGQIWGSNTDDWEEWTPPKKTKKVTMYKPVFKGYDKTYMTIYGEGWSTEKGTWGDHAGLVGWMTLEAEIEE